MSDFKRLSTKQLHKEARLLQRQKNPPTRAEALEQAARARGFAGAGEAIAWAKRIEALRAAASWPAAGTLAALWGMNFVLGAGFWDGATGGHDRVEFSGGPGTAGQWTGIFELEFRADANGFVFAARLRMRPAAASRERLGRAALGQRWEVLLPAEEALPLLVVDADEVMRRTARLLDRYPPQVVAETAGRAPSAPSPGPSETTGPSQVVAAHEGRAPEAAAGVNGTAMSGAEPTTPPGDAGSELLTKIWKTIDR